MEPQDTPGQDSTLQPPESLSLPDGTASSNPQEATPTMTPPPKSRKSLQLIIVIALVLVGSAAAWYFLAGPGKKDSAVTTDNKASTGQPADTQEATAALQTLTYTSIEKASISLEYPAAWAKVTSEEVIPGTDGLKLVTTKITSDEGNVLTLSTVYGKGGSCDPNELAFTLVKKLSTQTSGVEFREYSFAVGSTTTDGLRGLRLANVSELSADMQTMKEGDHATDTCTNISGWPAFADIEVDVGTAEDVSANKTYAELSADVDFLTMLQSMKFIKVE